MQVDLLTLYVLCFGTLAVASAMAFWESLSNTRRRSELRLWSVAYLLLCAGCMLFLMHRNTPIFASAGLANILILSGYALMVAGLSRMGGRPVSLPLLPIAAVAGTWLLVGPQLPPLIWHALAALAIAVIQLAGVLALTAPALRTLRSRPLAIGVFTIHGALYLGRGFTLPFLDPAANAGIVGTLAVATMFEGVLYAVAAPMVLLALVREEGENRLLVASQTDFLTGLANRRDFMNRVERHLARPNAAGMLLLFDLDHFKQVNDTHGHQTGDEVLRLFARVAEGELGTNDVVARLGGEEFVAFLPVCDLREGEAVATRTARRFSEAAAAGTGCPPMTVTVSVGLATVAGRSLDETIAAADQALYRAKRLGRNRVEREVPVPLAA